MQTNPLSDPIVEKNRVQHGKNIYFTRVVVTLALLWHQTSHSQNKFFFPSCTMYYYVPPSRKLVFTLELRAT